MPCDEQDQFVCRAGLPWNNLRAVQEHGPERRLGMNLAIFDDKRWTDVMDPVADNAAAIIIKNGGLEAMGNALDLLSNEPPDKSWPDGLRGFIDQARVPDGVDQARINVAQEWFTTWSAIGTATLYCASLPETYCLPGIAQLLLISHQLTDHATRRIRMTGQMLFDVMTPGGITGSSLALRSLRRTRRFFRTPTFSRSLNRQSPKARAPLMDGERPFRLMQTGSPDCATSCLRNGQTMFAT